ncbi:hypothetical protein AbHV_ORF69 [Abalone herpesvirus Victoria/AUS/2009]|uniref:RING-type domain-containing protein n=3 Tax=Herpesvirales TaxID=548681 RepID=K4JV71_ABHV|nr:hypothetical protein AbHV_ORF69 [Abalone herpesvirus Victoria/AUS/2009]ADP36932.1 p117c [Abalone herpesvirus Victoria/AUS/2007]AFU90081.1 hypothetical protein AbHV_ORF69 [Abalone herpesvirus Victoria/AUS/2009]AMW36244.1 hypothetical protein tc2005_p100c [Abalone herpesvirus Taiwan/2005]UCX57057.1 ORF67 [Haliotid herpesvirus 1]
MLAAKQQQPTALIPTAPPLYEDVELPPSYEDSMPPSYEDIMPPSYEESQASQLPSIVIQDECVKCMRTTTGQGVTMSFLHCGHCACTDCVEKIDNCPTCGEAFSEFIPIPRAKLMLFPCKHNEDLVMFLARNLTAHGTLNSSCSTCHQRTTAMTLIGAGRRKRQRDIKLDEHEKNLPSSVIRLFKTLAVEVNERGSPLKRLVNKLRLGTCVSSCTSRMNSSERCGICWERTTTPLYTDCCADVICELCVRVMAKQTRNPKQKCPCCHNKDFLTAMGQNGHNSATRVFMEELNRL